MNFTALVLTLLYIIGAIVCYGLHFAWWRSGYDVVLSECQYNLFRRESITSALVWPVSLVVLFFRNGFKDGIKFK